MSDIRAQLEAQLQTSLGDAYTIEHELGGGGMSHVFLATDRALNRRVVIKVMSSEMAGAVSVERFKREIALAARLQQANIVPLISAGDAGGVPYFVMPFVDGESVRARLTKGELPIPEAVGILKDVARALAYAHARDVVHRDIKPDNVLISGGTAMVTDFGVAKAVSDASTHGDMLTATGLAIGTPAYMAPEQASGDPNVDHRADIYAFGCLAYELLAGAAPFAGKSAHQIIASHLTTTPDPIERRRPSVPAALAALVTQCLEKNPADRPQNAERIIAMLDGMSLTSAATVNSAPRAPRARGSRLMAAGVAVLAIGALAIWIFMQRSRSAPSVLQVAVLPFENTSRDTTIDYLEDGISDHVRDAVARLNGVSVKARSSSRRFKGKSAREAGEALGATRVLLGTVSGGGSRIHVTAEVVGVPDENTIWNGTYDGNAESMAVIQDSIVWAVSEKLRGMSTRASTGRGTDDAVAYDEFMRGRFEGDRTNWPAALTHFQAAVARDPRFARALANQAIAFSNIPGLGQHGADSLDVLARESAMRALALDSTVADAYLALSNIKANELRLADALTPLERALTIDTTLSDVRVAYGLGLMQVGRVNDGLLAVQRAYALDPLSSASNGVLASGWLLAGRADSAIVRVKAGIALDPENVLMHQVLALALAYAGQKAQSAEMFEKAYRLGPDRFDGRANLVYARVAAGRMDDAVRERAAMDKEPPGNSPFYRRAIADIAIGKLNDAMTELERGVNEHEPLFGLMSIPCDLRLDRLKTDPRFDALMRRLGATACRPRLAWPFGRAP